MSVVKVKLGEPPKALLLLNCTEFSGAEGVPPPPAALISMLLPTVFKVTLVPPVIVTAFVSVLSEDTPEEEPPG